MWHFSHAHIYIHILIIEQKLIEYDHVLKKSVHRKDISPNYDCTLVNSLSSDPQNWIWTLEKLTYSFLFYWISNEFRNYRWWYHDHSQKRIPVHYRIRTILERRRFPSLLPSWRTCPSGCASRKRHSTRSVRRSRNGPMSKRSSTRYVRVFCRE